MKKQYVKPAMFSETFDICDSIAAGCGIAVGSTENVCGYSVPGVGYIFITGVGGQCMFTPGDGDGVCYHIPTAETKLFDS